MAFLSAFGKILGRAAPILGDIGIGLLQTQLQKKVLTKNARSALQAGRGNGVRSPVGPPAPHVVAGVMGPGSAVPPWHAAVHAGLAAGGKKRRRMNHTNFKALKRALRRVEGFTKVVKRAEKSLRKISPPRRSRAPAPSHHHHSRDGVV